MFKKFWLNYGATIIIVLSLCAVFFLGLFIGLNGRSAPSLQIAESGAVFSEKTAESDNKVVSSTQAKTVESRSKINTIDNSKIKTVSSNIAKTKKMTVVATAYCPCDECSDGYGRATATGKTATAGRTIAVDPKIIPYGTKVTINGITYIAEDCGGGIKGAKVDIFFDTHAETLQWGKRTVTATIEK